MQTQLSALVLLTFPTLTLSYADRDRAQIETILAEAEAQAEYARAALVS